MSLPPDNVVETLTRGDLFDFSELQHPLGVAVYNGQVFVADTYNHRIKVLDPATGKLSSFAGSGAPGLSDGPREQAQFYVPGGLVGGGDTL